MSQKRKSFLLPALVCLSGCLLAAILGAQTVPPPAAAETAAPATDSKPSPGTQEFIIGPLDVLFVHVLHEPDMTGRVEVGPDGMISLVLAGEFRAQGLTSAQLSDAIKERLRTTIRTPEVSVQV